MLKFSLLVSFFSPPFLDLSNSTKMINPFFWKKVDGHTFMYSILKRLDRLYQVGSISLNSVFIVLIFLFLLDLISFFSLTYFAFISYSSKALSLFLFLFINFRFWVDYETIYTFIKPSSNNLYNNDNSNNFIDTNIILIIILYSLFSFLIYKIKLYYNQKGLLSCSKKNEEILF